MKTAFPLLLAGSFLLGGCSTVESGNDATRNSLASGYASVVAAHDADGDERLSSAEIAAMVELGLPKDIPAPANVTELRDWLIGFYAAQDLDKDGYLTLAELLKGPLATFECMDVNRDQRLSKREQEGAMGRCESGPHHGGIGFLSEPEAK